jgi:IclR family pca regulon transcriptional regulator
MGHIILGNLPEEQVRAYLAGAELQPLTRKTLTDPEAILSRLRQCRTRGYSLNIDERFEGAGGAAVAIRDRVGRPHAAINIVTVTPRFRARQNEIVAALTKAAQELEVMVFGAVSGAVLGAAPANRTVKA